MADASFILDGFGCTQAQPKGAGTRRSERSKLRRSGRERLARGNRDYVTTDGHVAVNSEREHSSWKRGENKHKCEEARPSLGRELKDDCSYFLDDLQLTGAAGNQMDAQHKRLQRTMEELQKHDDWKMSLGKDGELAQSLALGNGRPRVCSENSFVFVAGMGPSLTSSLDLSAVTDEGRTDSNDCRMPMAARMKDSSYASKVLHLQKWQSRCRPSVGKSLAAFRSGNHSSSHRVKLDLAVHASRGMSGDTDRSASILEVDDVYRSDSDGSSDSQCGTNENPVVKRVIEDSADTRLAHSSSGGVKNKAHVSVTCCTHPNCSLKAKREGRCGNHQVCPHSNCDKRAATLGKSCKHGGSFKPICSYPDCPKQSQVKGLCMRHGGFRTCKADGCARRADTKGLCRLHGGGTKCKCEGCDKFMYRHGYCFKHCREHGIGKFPSEG